MSASNEEISADITCKPIDNLEEVLRYMDRPPGWAAQCIQYEPNEKKLRNCDLYHNSNSEYLCHFEPEKKETHMRYSKSDLLPKTLICHDMANGYHDDRFVDGTSNSEAYHFYDWAAIDIFCYFSHHFITIPPLAWINAAHLHGVKVIGTLITEWADGEALWVKILASPEDYKTFAHSLVAITKYLKFEGWLLNVENKMAKPKMLLDFVEYFMEQLHLAIPGAVLLWYDSVTINGDLIWQNALNQYNIDFFRACDGIFTNYSWKEKDVAQSAALAASEGRPRDVFVGVDVWGRNFYGGGQFNTAEAVKIAFKHGCSLAIFAQAWTYEAADENERYPSLGQSILTSGERRTKYDQFLLREKALWDTLWPYLNTRLPDKLPFRTSFCRGNGQKGRRYGEVIKDEQWHNLKDTEYQPNSIHGPHGYRLIKIPHSQSPQEPLEQGNRTGLMPPATIKPAPEIVRFKLVIVPEETLCVKQYMHDSFNGGSCIIAEPFDSSTKEGTASRLFHCDFACRNKLIVCVVTKTLDIKEQFLNIICSMVADKNEKKFDLVLVGSCAREVLQRHAEANLLFPVDSNELKFVQKYLLVDTPGLYVPIENACDWKVRYYIVDHPGTTMSAISCRTATPHGAILLGHISVCPVE